MRVAIALSGEMRGKTACLEKLMLNVVIPFKQAGASVVDIFCHTRKDDWWLGAAPLPFRCLWVEENRPRQDIITSSANPPSQGDYAGTDRRSHLYQSYLQQYWSMDAVGQMIIRAELQDQVAYDWVVRSRPDVHIEQPLPIDRLLQDQVNVPWNDWWPYEINGKRIETCTDKFAVGASRLMLVYLDKLADLQSFCSTHRIQGEAFTAWQMHLHGIKWHRHEGIKVIQADDPYKDSVRP